MELDCTIAGISQDMSFGENVTMTFLLIRLPDGQQVRAAIDDAAASAVVALSVAQSGQPTPAMRVNGAAHAPAALPSPPPRAPAPAAPRDPDPEPTGSLVPSQEWSAEAPSLPKAAAAPFSEDAPRIFGGQDGVDEADSDYGEPTQAAPALVPGSNIQRLRNGRIVVPAKTVPRTDMGYPITSAGGLDPETLTSSENKNDDGVGSV